MTLLDLRNANALLETSQLQVMEKSKGGGVCLGVPKLSELSCSFFLYVVFVLAFPASFEYDFLICNFKDTHITQYYYDNMIFNFEAMSNRQFIEE